MCREGRGCMKRGLTCTITIILIPLQVELKKTKRVYAMKVIKKSLVMDEEVSRESCPISL